MARVSGKVALISGGARGMGASHARLLVAEGAKVVIGDLLDDEGATLAAELGDEHARYVHLDVTDYAQWESAVAAATEAFGRLDIVVNNAGIANFGSIEEYPIDAWQKIIDINLTGVFYGIKAAIPALKESGAGSIINISSTAGLQGYEALPGYNAAKFGVRGLTKNAALDLGRYNIRVNSVHPGVIRTPMTEELETPQNHVALHRVGEPIELSNLILFLASDESSFSTGAEFVADGGETAGLAHYES
ncbi:MULTISPECIES: glucose 1-dehydrogenase [unclassified Agromyces]|uniref:glucose 1-dehydrogenase n=1 Tax=unclassified Agromyces TaxID=2639701 RepID=UPI0007B219DD|nr:MULTISPECIES: glucose 1-dehydrogenase [unclassified Agromyces]KZE93983.1 3-alpha-(or 20-beta)-hydroxysteroid dehydrogenase [Agromyces sp. NDB4Y10]MCK8609361.1 SDR family oxidoreductase [Agromyces sp. C10]